MLNFVTVIVTTVPSLLLQYRVIMAKSAKNKPLVQVLELSEEGLKLPFDSNFHFGLTILSSFYKSKPLTLK